MSNRQKTKLQLARQEKGLTASELGALVGLDASSVNRIERGLQECGRDKVRALAAALEVDVLDVVFNKPEKKSAA